MSQKRFLFVAGLAVATSLVGGAPSAFTTSAYADSRQDDAIRRAFRDALRRSPSERELRRYRDLMDQGWSERDIREDLRNDSGSRRGDDRGGSDSRLRGEQRRGEDPDKIVRRAYQDILEREPDSAGLRLYRSRIIDERWSEQDVREALRKSPEYRDKNTMTRQKAEEVVRRAYRSVLNREPDAGSQGYVDKVFREHWTEQQVAAELRRSDEYRNRRR